MVRKCSRLQYLRFLLTLSSTGERGSRGIGRPGGWAMACVHGATTSSPSRAPPATCHAPPPPAAAEVHRGVVECFARGVEV